MGIEMLGHRYVPEIMLELRKHPDLSKIELACRLGHTRTIMIRLNELEREGWVEYHKSVRYNAKLVRLTHNGEIVANSLHKIVMTLRRPSEGKDR